MKRLTSQYKKYASGGAFAAGGSGWGTTVQAAQMGMGIVNDITDANATPDVNGLQKPSMGKSIGSSALSGAALGTSILPGWGTAIGAVVGAGVGWISGSSQQRKYKRLTAEYSRARDMRNQQTTAARIGADPSIVYGNPDSNYYANGGQLRGLGPVKNGSVEDLSYENVEFKGPSHEEGGIELPANQAEVEGQETMNNDYVFSKRLGFADAHRKLAKAAGKIEQKPQTPERVRSLELIEAKTAALRQKQELVKAYLQSQEQS